MKNDLEKYLDRVVTYTVSFELPTNEKVNKAVDFAFYNSKDTKVEASTGGPCYWPYVRFTGEDESETKACAISFIKYIKRFKGVEIDELKTDG